MLSVEEAAAKAGVHIESVRRWIRQGELAAALPSRKKGYQIREEVFEEFLNGKKAEKQNGYISAKNALQLLADEWKVSQREGYCRIAHEVALNSGLIGTYRREWDAWDGDMVDPDKDCEALHARKYYLKPGQEHKLGIVEGKLILEKFLTEEEFYRLVKKN